MPVSLDPAHLEHKMVASRRGGYCFEQNLLFGSALEALGVDDVVPMLARVRAGGDGEPGPLNHLLLRVVTEGRAWIADVGFGGAGLLEPVPFAPGESVQSGWRYRVIEEGRELVLQTFQDGAWADLYGFVPEPVPMTDIEVANWYTATHPASIFVTGIFAGARREDRCTSLLVNETATVIERTREGSSAAPVAMADVPGVFAARLGLDGVFVGPDNRLDLDQPVASDPHDGQGAE
jgi:N-hydroxyarylamine O-acetyltransferase